MKRGYCYLVGDILHRGHIIFIKSCKALCDKLICGVLTDEAVMEKKRKPIIGFDERFFVMQSIKYIDLVVAQNTYSPTNNCNAFTPDILFESSSHEELGYNDGRQMIILPYYVEQSSTKIKEKIINEKSD